MNYELRTEKERKKIMEEMGENNKYCAIILDVSDKNDKNDEK